MGFQETQRAADGGGRPLQAPGGASETALINGSHKDFHCVDAIHLPAPGTRRLSRPPAGSNYGRHKTMSAMGRVWGRRTLNDVQRPGRHGAILSAAADYHPASITVAWSQ